MKKSLKNYKLCIKMQSTHVYLNLANFDDDQWKLADASKTQEVCHVIHITVWSFLGKL